MIYEYVRRYLISHNRNNMASNSLWIEVASRKRRLTCFIYSYHFCFCTLSTIPSFSIIPFHNSSINACISNWNVRKFRCRDTSYEWRITYFMATCLIAVTIDLFSKFVLQILQATPSFATNRDRKKKNVRMQNTAYGSLGAIWPKRTKEIKKRKINVLIRWMCEFARVFFFFFVSCNCFSIDIDANRVYTLLQPCGWAWACEDTHYTKHTAFVLFIRAFILILVCKHASMSNWGNRMRQALASTCIRIHSAIIV